jgi:urea transport system permease protein
VIWANTVLAQGAEAGRDARIEAIRILGHDSNPQSRQKLMPLVERDAAGKYKEADEGVRVAAQWPSTSCAATSAAPNCSATCSRA